VAAGLQLFQIVLPTMGSLAAWRLFSEPALPYQIEASASSVFWSAAADDIRNLGAAERLVDFRLRAAAHGDGVQVGSVFARREATGASIIDFGIADDETVFLQMFDLPKVLLQGEQSRQLLAALHRLGEDARSLGGIVGGTSRLAR
jgi:hypothetical protein